MEHRNTTQLQGRLAVLAMVAGILIACACLFIIPPPGEISTSAITIVSELLIVSGALLGIKVSFDVKLQQFMTKLQEDMKKEEKTSHEDEQQ